MRIQTCLFLCLLAHPALAADLFTAPLVAGTTEVPTVECVAVRAHEGAGPVTPLAAYTVTMALINATTGATIVSAPACRIPSPHSNACAVSASVQPSTAVVCQAFLANMDAVRVSLMALDTNGIVRSVVYSKPEDQGTESPPVIPPPCSGDCDGSGDVTVTELLKLMNIALGTAQPAACPHGVPSGAAVDIALIIQAAHNALTQCGGG